MLSIIIPIYNEELHIDYCLACLQDLDIDHEIIVVDDHSNDHSCDIVKKYDIVDDLIELSENHGAGHARNVGLNNANGDHIYFIDADDYIDPKALNRVYRYMQKYDHVIDQVIVGSTIDGVKHNAKGSGLYDMDSPQARYSFFRDIDILRATWDKIYRYDIVKDLRFSEDCIDEEPPFVIPALCRSETIYISDEVVYNFSTNINGSSAKRKGFDGYIKSWEQTLQQLNKDGFAESDIKLLDYLTDINLYHYKQMLEADKTF